MDEERPAEVEHSLERRIGTPEEILAARAEMDRLALVPGARVRGTPEARALNRQRMNVARLMRRKSLRTRNKVNLRAVKVQIAERIARRTQMEAAGILEDTARALRLAVNRYGKIASTDLADFLSEQLKTGTPAEQKEAARLLSEIYLKIFESHKQNSEKLKRHQQHVANWPAEGEKS